MRIVKCISLLLALCLPLCGLAGCGKDEEPNYSALIEPALDVALENCLDADTLNAVLGYNMQLLGVYEDGTQMVFSNEAGEQVMVQMLNQTREGFDGLLEGMEPLEAVEGLGESAYWHSGTAQLMTYANGYAISVCITISDDMDVLSPSKSFTQCILDNLATLSGNKE